MYIFLNRGYRFTHGSSFLSVDPRGALYNTLQGNWHINKEVTGKLKKRNKSTYLIFSIQIAFQLAASGRQPLLFIARFEALCKCACVPLFCSTYTVPLICFSTWQHKGKRTVAACFSTHSFNWCFVQQFPYFCKLFAPAKCVDGWRKILKGRCLGKLSVITVYEMIPGSKHM